MNNFTLRIGFKIAALAITIGFLSPGEAHASRCSSVVTLVKKPIAGISDYFRQRAVSRALSQLDILVHFGVTEYQKLDDVNSPYQYWAARVEDPFLVLEEKAGVEILPDLFELLERLRIPSNSVAPSEPGGIDFNGFIIFRRAQLTIFEGEATSLVISVLDRDLVKGESKSEAVSVLKNHYQRIVQLLLKDGNSDYKNFLRDQVVTALYAIGSDDLKQLADRIDQEIRDQG